MAMKSAGSRVTPIPTAGPAARPWTMVGRCALIVGIGASAEGSRLQELFRQYAADSGLAFVLVQHLSPDHKSMLVELLGRSTTMEVMEAADGVQVTPTVSSSSPDATLTMNGGRLRVARPARGGKAAAHRHLLPVAGRRSGRKRHRRRPGGDRKRRLAGPGTIKERGGLTLAQAEFDHHALPGMPLSATATGQSMRCWRSKPSPPG